MSFGNSQTQGFNNSSQVTTNKIVVFGPDQGIFVYSGTPAAGNLIETAGIESPGTDDFGNAYLSGSTTYSDDSGIWLASNNNGGIFNFFISPTGFGGPYTPVAEIGFDFVGTTGHVNIQSSDGVSASFNGTNFTIPQGLSPDIQTLPNDTNSGTTWVSGERAFMNNNWVAPINNNFAAIVAALQAAGIAF